MANKECQDFGQEKLDYATLGQIKTILDECPQRPAVPPSPSELAYRPSISVRLAGVRFHI